jgi:hypothetical protein
MGFLIQDDTTLDVLAKLNRRFGPGGIKEMVALQKEFQIFSGEHTLEDSFVLLGIVPCDRVERDRWLRFLDTLKKYPSDIPNLNGYKRVIAAFEQALIPVTQIPAGIVNPPVHVTVHSMKDDPRVTFSMQGHPLIFTTQSYRILSIPTKPARVARQEAATAAKARRATKARKK